MYAPELEAAILADPEADEAYLVYADWLQSQGDPRGELAAVQAARARRETAELARREAELFRRHGQDWLGGLELESARWRYGWLRHVKLRGDGESYAALAGLASARFLTSLSFAELDSPGSLHAAVLRVGVPWPLRQLRLVDTDRPSRVDLGDCSRLLARAGQLRELRLCGGSFHLGRLDLPELREAHLESTGFTGDNLRDLARSSWPELERLSLLLGNPEAGGSDRCEDLWPLLARDDLGLWHLGLTNASYANELCGVLHDSPLLAGLGSLDLSFGNLGEAGVESLLQHAEAYVHIGKLDVSKNFIDATSLERLRDHLPNLVSRGQRDQALDEPDRPSVFW